MIGSSGRWAMCGVAGGMWAAAIEAARPARLVFYFVAVVNFMHLIRSPVVWEIVVRRKIDGSGVESMNKLECARKNAW